MSEKPINTETKIFSLEKVEQISESLLAQVKNYMSIQCVLPIEEFSNIIYDFNWIEDKEGQDPNICNIFLINISHSFIQIMNICPFNTDLMQFGKKVIVSRIFVLLLLLSSIDVLESTKISFKNVWGHTNDSMFDYCQPPISCNNKFSSSLTILDTLSYIFSPLFKISFCGGVSTDF